MDDKDINMDMTDNIQVRIDDDKMKAYISISPYDESEDYSVDFLRGKLAQNGVVFGIKKDVLQNIITQKLFYIEHLIAEGEEPVFGKDGYFDIPFSFDFDRKPRILPDGSADYNQFDNFCKVSKDDVIAVYKHSTKGKNGSDVCGKILSGKNGREQRNLSGKGFKLNENNPDEYIALIDGRLEYVENKSISISNLYEIKGDVNHATGDVQFPGDVHIHGNVTAGATVRASGQIIVDGHVESANLFAGQDIVLKNGMQGAGKGILVSKGNVSAKFFEQTSVKSSGTIVAGAIMNCTVEAEDRIVVSGRIGALIGGRTQAVSGIETNILGNMVEAKTFIKVGGGNSLVNALNKNQEDIDALNEIITKIDGNIEKIEQILKHDSRKELAEKKLELIRQKFLNSSKLDELNKTRGRLMQAVGKSKRAKVTIHKSVYPGVTININDIVFINKTENYNISYEKRGGNIITSPNVV